MIHTYKDSTTSNDVISEYIHCDVIDDVDQCRYFKSPKQTEKERTYDDKGVNQFIEADTLFVRYFKHSVFLFVPKPGAVSLNYSFFCSIRLRNYSNNNRTHLYNWHFCSRLRLSVAETALIRRPSRTNDQTMS